MKIAVSWYPEQWPRHEWDRDLAAMRSAGIGLVRVADFAWSALEPADGDFQLDWLEEAIALAGAAGMEVLLATPTAAPPIWLTRKHPEILRHGHDGIPDGEMARCHFRHASAVYRTYTARIARKLAERFGSNPHVIRWQIDNEYTGFSHDEETGEAFSAFLQREYGTLDELNRRLGTAYWSRTISDWAQISGHFRSGISPTLIAAFRRFVTETIRSYQAVQIAEIRPLMGKHQQICHNFHVPFASGDNTVIARDLDQVLFDYYTVSPHDPADAAWWFALARGLKRQNFWLIETQAGTVKYHAINAALPRGVTRQIAWQAVGHGADLVGYWQWRPCTGGQEQFWGTLVGPSGQPRPVLEEVTALGAEFAAHCEALAGTVPVYDAVLYYSDEDRWMIDHDRYHHAFGAHEHLSTWHAALCAQGLGIEVMDPSWPLQGHTLAIATALPKLTPERESSLLAWVRDGGHLVIGPRSFQKNQDGAWLTEARAPGLTFGAAAGSEVVEFYALAADLPVEGFGPGVCARHWAEQLHAANPADVLARYGAGHSWLSGQPAVVTRACGDGRISHLGFWPSPESFPAVVRWLAEQSGLSLNPLPAGVSRLRRRAADREIHITINHASGDVTLETVCPA
jgi:beta-galactosidase